jgi:hypothetical protein
MHASICYTPGWGFFSFSSPPDPEPLEAIPRDRLYHLTLLSPEAYPWIEFAQRSSEDQARIERTVEFQMHLFQPGTGFGKGGACTPSTPVAIAGLRGEWCEDRFDRVDDAGGKEFKPDGAFHSIKILLPLRQIPEAQDPLLDLTGSKMLAVIVIPSSRYDSEVDSFWQIARTVRPY